MGQIKWFNSLKNTKPFNRLFNYKNSSPTYQIDSLKNTSNFERAFDTSKNLALPEATIELQGSMSGVRFKNSSSLVMSIKVEKSYSLYTLTGTLDTMSEEQAAAWSASAVAGQTTFLVITYGTNFKNAASRRLSWVDSVEEVTSDTRTLPSSGYQTTVLGISGPGVVSDNKPYYKIDILDSESNILGTYVFDVSSLYS